jgi:hypothetical protein
MRPDLCGTGAPPVEAVEAVAAATALPGQPSS